MIKQSINLTEPNDAWLSAKVESKEYSSKADVVNELIRQVRAQEEEREFIRAKLIAAEKSGFTDMSKDAILTEIKETLRSDGEL